MLIIMYSLCVIVCVALIVYSSIVGCEFVSLMGFYGVDEGSEKGKLNSALKRGRRRKKETKQTRRTNLNNALLFYFYLFYIYFAKFVLSPMLYNSLQKKQLTY